MKHVRKEEGEEDEEEKEEGIEQNQRKSQGDITFFLLVYKTYTEAEVIQALKVKKES